MKMIDKDALLAEIEKRIADNKKDIERASHKNIEDYFEGYEDALVLLKEKFLDTLEVKEVDLEEVHYKPLDEDFERDAVSFCLDTGLNTTPYIAKTIAKHFFELGLKSTERRISYDKRR